MAWRLARSLDVLRKQIDDAYPGRSKASDGTIGDAAHASRSSDHNAWIKDGSTGVVSALDITNDTAHGVDSGDIAEALRQSRDARIKYLIADGRIANCDPMNGEPAWAWRPYHGANPHRQHFHISVKPTKAFYDDASPWDIDAMPAPATTTKPVTVPLKRFTNITATVFGGPDDTMASGTGAYGVLDHRKPGVALPFRFKVARPKVRVYHGGKSVVCDVVDVGPWNIGDEYWARPDGRPAAETQHRTGLRDSYNRIPTNDAGIDLTPAAAAAIGLKGKGKVDWEFVSADTPVEKPKVPGVIVGTAVGGGAAGGAVVKHGVEQGWGWAQWAAAAGFGLMAIGILAVVVLLVLRWWRSRQAAKVEVEAKEPDLHDTVRRSVRAGLETYDKRQLEPGGGDIAVADEAGYLDRAEKILAASKTAADERARRASDAGRAAVDGVILRQKPDKPAKASRKPGQSPPGTRGKDTGKKPKRTTAKPAGQRGAPR